MPEIRFEAAEAVYGGTRVLHPTTLRLTERRIGVIGANGSGKSTLARLVNGLGAASAGRVTVDGADPARRGREVRRRVGFLFSDADNQIVMPTVREDVALSLRRSGLPREEREGRIDAALRRFGLEGRDEQSPHLLSGGEKQMLALAAVTVLDPETIVADEPTTLLDLVNRRRVRRTFAELPQQLITVTHDLDLLEGYERVVCLDGGRVVDDGPADRVIADYVARMGERE